jgi:RHS repeat-associated protein
LLLLELDGLSGNAIVRKYTWGLDLSGQSGGPASGRSIDDAGGVSGLLATYDADSSKSYAYFHDANGNVGQLIDRSDGSIDAKYEYGAYGNNLLDPSDPNESGPYAGDNPIRFSTKYFDGELDYAATTNDGLYYFGYRYYSARLGRWNRRDPFGPGGGLNRYSFVRNSPPIFIDPLGMRPRRPRPPMPCTGSLPTRGPARFGVRVTGTLPTANAKPPSVDPTDYILPLVPPTLETPPDNCEFAGTARISSAKPTPGAKPFLGWIDHTGGWIFEPWTHPGTDDIINATGEMFAGIWQRSFTWMWWLNFDVTYEVDLECCGRPQNVNVTRLADRPSTKRKCWQLYRWHIGPVTVSAQHKDSHYVTYRSTIMDMWHLLSSPASDIYFSFAPNGEILFFTEWSDMMPPILQDVYTWNTFANVHYAIHMGEYWCQK